MARTLKNKIVAHLHTLIARYGLEGVENWGPHECGAIHVQHEGELLTLFRIALNLYDHESMSAAVQRENETISVGALHLKDAQPTDEQRSRSFPYLKYADTAGMAKFIAAVEAELDKHGRASA